MKVRPAGLFAAAACVAVGTALIAGFIVVGPPMKARLERLDDQRVQDLRSISSSIASYAAGHHSLPDVLGSMRANGDIDAASVRDPVTRAPYEYRRTGARSYELCAVFATAAGGNGEDSVWKHPIGRYCFSRETGS